MITQERLKELISYDPHSGLITQRPRTEVDIPRLSRLKSWNTRYAGKVCSCISKSNGYIVVRFSGSLHLAHRLAFLYVYGFIPEQVDHINGNKTDNRIANLRASSPSHNSTNLKILKNNTSGYHGVYKNKSSYYVQIWKSGKCISGGSFKNIGDAIKKRKKMERELGFTSEHGTR